MTDTAAAKPKRKKSETRQRDKQVKFRCLSDEFNNIAAGATQSGLSVGAYLRALARHGDPGLRAKKRLPVDATALRTIEYLHNKYGNNMNQIAKSGNSGFPVDLPELRKALKEWAEIRDAILQALGKMPSPDTPSTVTGG